MSGTLAQRLWRLKRLVKDNLPPTGWERHRLSHKDAQSWLASTPSSQPMRVESRSIGLAEFERKYNRPHLPCVLRADSYARNPFWDADNLVASFGTTLLKCGESASGEILEISLADYARYSAMQTDDEPLYVFDEDFCEVRTPSETRAVLASASTLSDSWCFCEQVDPRFREAYQVPAPFDEMQVRQQGPSKCVIWIWQ
jgi:hypothetical protein